MKRLPAKAAKLVREFDGAARMVEVMGTYPPKESRLILKNYREAKRALYDFIHDLNTKANA